MKSSNLTGALNWFGMLLLLIIGGCSNVYVSSDYDPAVDRSRYVTYSWSTAEMGGEKGNDPAVSPFVYNRIHIAVDRELASRRYQLKTSGPVDFIVRVQVQKALRSALYQDPFYYPRVYSRGYYRGQWYLADPWWGPYGYPNYVRFYEEGYLVIDIIDARSNKPVWRGSAWGVLREHPDPESIQKDVDQTVSSIIEKFSPLKKER
jgi:hypothetical protein